MDGHRGRIYIGGSTIGEPQSHPTQSPDGFRPFPEIFANACHAVGCGNAEVTTARCGQGGQNGAGKGEIG
jgi:hypothetical protein